MGEKREQYWADPERYRGYARTYYAADPQKHRQASAEYRRCNPLAVAQSMRAWRRQNATHVRLYDAAYRRAHPQAVRARLLSWIGRNPERVQHYSRVRRARKANAAGTHTPADVQRMREVQRDCCAYCLAPLARSGAVDHMTPLSRDGTDWPWNLCLACAQCNGRKFTRTAGEFLAVLLKDKRGGAVSA